MVATLLLAPQVLAQNPTGTLTGVVRDQDGGSLPGVTITARSEALQGVRTTQTGANGAYKVAFMPPGLYTLTYEMDSFATATQTVRINAAQTAVSDIQMQLAEVVEEIVVSSNLETISETGAASTTYSQEEIEKLSIGREPVDAVVLTPGVHATSVAAGDSISINGAMTFENLWLINGVVINENVRGGQLDLFIEDAIQETTTTVSSISAEYGRFTGGVVNAITKSGGNQLSGSLRVNFSNEDWESEDALRRVNPDADPKADVTNDELEVTLGGPILKDRLWFFLAGRDRNTSTTEQLTLTGITYPSTNEQQRFEGKATVGLTQSHNVVLSYLEIDQLRTNTAFVREMDLQSLNAQREDPQQIQSGNYTGILTSNFFLEAQYSERDFTIAVGSGGPAPDANRSIESLIPGTMLRHRPTSRRYHAATFCGTCEDELRNNENALLKGSYFLASESAGTHDLVFGVDTFTDVRFSINHQTGSDFQVWAEDNVIDANNNIFPVFTNDNTWLIWWHPFNLDIARPTDFTTNSLYANDNWQLNERWSLNVGFRYDENDGQDSGGTTTVDDAKISPRLGVQYDTKGDGDLVVNASIGTYVAAIANTRADSTSQGGALGRIITPWEGPLVNADPDCAVTGTCISSEDALAILFDWWFRDGRFDLDPATRLPTYDFSNVPGENNFGLIIPGATAIVPDTLKSPAANEITLGATKRLGTKGLFRADLVFRDWEDFYSNRTVCEACGPSPTGLARNAAGEAIGDLTHVGNFGDNVLEREYWGLNLQGRYRLSDRLTLAGNYTLSELEGNINGEAENSGPTPSSPNSFGEFFDNAWSSPVGPLLADQEHRLRAWAIYDILESDRHHLNVSLMHSFLSGTPYSATGAVNTRINTQTGQHILSRFPFIYDDAQGGYFIAPTTVTYFFSDRGAFQLDDLQRTDVALNYSFRWNAFGRSMEVFLQPEVLNLFDETSVVDLRDVNTAVNTFANGGACRSGANGRCEDFNAFTETPVEGVHYQLGDDFGQPDQEDAFQAPRTFRFSVGFRF